MLFEARRKKKKEKISFMRRRGEIKYPKERTREEIHRQEIGRYFLPKIQHI